MEEGWQGEICKVPLNVIIIVIDVLGLLGVKRKWNFGGKRTHVLRNELKRMFSPECNFAAE